MQEQVFEDRVAVSLGAEGVATVMLRRPEKMNALDVAMFKGLAAAGAWLREAVGLRAVVLAGEGKAFCAGLDMANFEGLLRGQALDPALGRLAERSHGQANLPQHICWQWRMLEVPVVAALHGVALGGGLQLALGADVRLVAPDARLSVREMHWGLVPDMAGMALLRELVRADIARELVFSGRMVDAQEACQIGLATRLVQDPLAQALELARQMAGFSPQAMRAAKRLLNSTADASAGELLLAESLEQLQLLGSADQREAVMAGLEKRPPVFRDA
ncbi:enoyl-CoA hydratase [Vandammella animalimorsus]|uniref:Enoyl-CoA hydratase n=1 Tax=Vandammella animalimorsus TaxID=2029117 RepID=A0A2A2T2Y4_9BURK|nr:crotonase/enoyl-CoA hydratase family protein [Vandammella animalimorsus]PAT31009.1 enoyl-CoA hydratase [Vandammella animalimorsus]PAX15551.1 enoyl-CoA hydratase [Vandammella animalimorsus]PAX17304.1 enoyl-CoA hydratase [Vandammella animalimorsus]